MTTKPKLLICSKCDHRRFRFRSGSNKCMVNPRIQNLWEPIKGDYKVVDYISCEERNRMGNCFDFKQKPWYVFWR